MAISSTAMRRVLVCRSVNDANRGGTLEDVDEAALRDAFGSLKLLEPVGAAQIEDPRVPGEPDCPTTMPKSCRLLLVRHRAELVGVVVHTFKGGAQGQQDGIISQASGNPADRSNLESFFRS
jgi:hypothetical protein